MEKTLIPGWMISDVKNAGVLKVVLPVILAAQLVACGGGGGGGDAGSGGTADIASDVQINGSVGDGPVTGATIVVYAKNGNELETTTSDNTASFQTIITARGRDYPLLTRATGGFDLVTGAKPEFEMLSVMLSPSDRQQNINPFTTLIVKTAQHMPGGLKAKNVNTAMNTVMNTLGFGLDPTLVPNPFTTAINTSNVASIVKASEALAEMVRRTSTTLSAEGTLITCDDVLTALAADLRDGSLDGRGAHGANARVAAVAAVASAQVLVELMRNTLEVEGVVATGILDEAIVITQPGISSSRLTASVHISAGLLTQAKNSLAAAMMLDSSSRVAEIARSVEAIAPDSLPAKIASVLTANASSSLDNALVLSASATTKVITNIGQIMRNSGNVANANRAPVISGTPAGSVVADKVYSFQPSATDADGDALSFSISNKPSWAKFNRSTGQLSGKPKQSKVGNYDNIVIKVSDGTASASLSAFSIRVDTAEVNTGKSKTGKSKTGNLSLNWKAPAARTDGTPLSLADIDGYRIHYGKSSGTYNNHFTLSDGTAQKVTLTDIPVGTYYLVMTTFDSAGRESDYSSEVSKAVH